jgi:alpha-acetolactate decarboxylase
MPMPLEGQGGKEPGKAAKGEVSEDGSFRLTTFDTFDGAVVGRHRVSYESPEGGEEEDAEAVSESEEEAAPSRQKKAARPVYHIQGELLVEVKAGEANTFVVEVVPGADRSEEE